MTRPKLLLTLAAAALATSTRAWPRLDEALANYPSIHARETAKIKNGDKTAKFVLSAGALEAACLLASVLQAASPALETRLRQAKKIGCCYS